MADVGDAEEVAGDRQRDGLEQVAGRAGARGRELLHEAIDLPEPENPEQLEARQQAGHTCPDTPLALSLVVSCSAL